MPLAVISPARLAAPAALPMLCLVLSYLSVTCVLGGKSCFGLIGDGPCAVLAMDRESRGVRMIRGVLRQAKRHAGQLGVVAFQEGVAQSQLQGLGVDVDQVQVEELVDVGAQQ